jgi:transposase
MRPEILNDVERRRRWSIDEKLRIVFATAAEGSCVAQVARENDIPRAQIYQWRRELQRKGLLSAAPAMFVPVELTAPDKRSEQGGAVVAHDGHVEIGLRNGRSLRVGFDVPDSVVFRMIRLAEAL